MKTAHLITSGFLEGDCDTSRGGEEDPKILPKKLESSRGAAGALSTDIRSLLNLLSQLLQHLQLTVQTLKIELDKMNNFSNIVTFKN